MEDELQTGFGRRLGNLSADGLYSRGVVDAVTKAVIETIGDNGYCVEIGYVDALPVVVAADLKTGERFVVRGSDLYETVVELAQQVGIELEDG